MEKKRHGNNQMIQYSTINKKKQLLVAYFYVQHIEYDNATWKWKEY